MEAYVSPREHLEETQTGRRKEKRKKQKGKAIETDLSKKERTSEVTTTNEPSENERLSRFWPVNCSKKAALRCLTGVVVIVGFELVVEMMNLVQGNQ
ncbi:MAG: hypothetical protein AUF64_02305 [Chloroflexi bacterium 13_1_20CM_54_36]|nr:MAG: hypothetical protein AUF64_02305 [Chloroflexi bacterium 13_1_20CM_54_36]